MIAPIQSSQASETPEYFICQYMPDPFRREPRNVGVIVRWNDAVESQFIGETANEVDGRGLSWIRDLGAYKEWVRHWKKISRGNPGNLGDRLLETSKTTYYVLSGGVVDQVGNDDISRVCQFLYSTIVSRRGIDELVEDEEAIESPKIRLARSVSTSFRKAGILGSRANLIAPVLEDQYVIGKTKPHRFAYAQKSSSTLRPIELINIETGNLDQIRYHAGWTKLAFTDVRESHESVDVDAVSIVIPALSSTRRDLNEYCLDLLNSASRVIDWTVESDRSRFIDDCKKTSGLLL